MKILFLTDLHGVTTGLSKLLAREADVDLCLLGGDLTSFRGPRAAYRVLAPLQEAYRSLRAVAGNTDRPEVSRWLAERGWSLDGRGEAFGGLWLSGVAGSNHTPLRAPIERTETELAARLQAGARPPEASNLPWILLTHVPPRDTRCDRIFAGQHVGSTAVRAFLASHRPEIHLCGHVHEGAALQRVAHTQVCNPGAWTASRYAVITVPEPAGGEQRPVPRVELRRLVLPPLQRWGARTRMMVAKVSGYARHRLGR